MVQHWQCGWCRRGSGRSPSSRSNAVDEDDNAEAVRQAKKDILEIGKFVAILPEAKSTELYWLYKVVSKEEDSFVGQ